MLRVFSNKHNLCREEVKGDPGGLMDGLHTDQSPDAQKAAWATERERCPSCLVPTLGWWQGVVVSHEKSPMWLCAVCSAILGFVPPPQGYLRLLIHEEVLAHWKIPLLARDGRFYHHQLTATLQVAFPLMLAWSMEMNDLVIRHLRHGVVAYPDSPDGGNHFHPLLLPRPSWLSEETFFLDAGTYAYSDEDRIIHAAIREVIGNPNWYRTALSEHGGAWPYDGASHETFHGPLKPNHPGHLEGFHTAEVVRWGSLGNKGKVELDGTLIDPDVHMPIVEAAIQAIVASRVAPESSSPWRALGLAF
jgi:hypothetical protein